MLIILTVLVVVLSAGCNGSDGPVTPPSDNPDIRVSLTRLVPSNPQIDAVAITVTRTQDGSVELPGRDIEITASSGNVSPITDRGDGTYEAIWTGSPVAEVVLIARDLDSDPVVESGVTFLALEHLIAEWDVPIKLASPISTNGWETAACIYPDGKRLAFAYITLDLVALAAGVERPIGEERPGQSYVQTLEIYIAEKPNSPSWWTGWTVHHADVNNFQAKPTNISAPSISSDGLSAFCTVQEIDGDTYGPSAIYSVDPDFSLTPVPLGPPVDLTGLGEDNPYYDANSGWLYFDTYDLGDPLSKQNIWAAQTLGAGQFDDPEPLTNLNTVNVETQAFMDAETSQLYFASDRMGDEFQLAIWRAETFGTLTSQPELVAEGALALGRPSVTADGEWFCFVYAHVESGGANADIAMCHKIE